MRIYTAEPEAEQMNLTPLIDVVFLLLIFFLVATQFAKDERDLTVKVPDVAKAQALSMTKDLIVNVTTKGEYKIRQQVLSHDQLGALLSQVGIKNPQQKVLIRGDGNSALKYNLRVAGLCKKAKIEARFAVLEK